MEIAELRIHIGAHKTATTHLQDSLALQRAAIAAQGKDYIPLKEVRSLQLARLVERRKGWRRLLLSSALRRKWNEAIDTIGSGSSTLIISDENFLGGAKHLLRPDLYPRAETRMAALRDFVESGKLRLFLSIRSYDTLLPSAYVQALRSGAIRPGFDRYRRVFRQTPPSWLQLVDRIKSTIPGVQLKIWTLEHYATSSAEIMQGFCDADIVDAKLDRPRETMSPSADAVASLELAAAGLLRGERYRVKARRIVSEDVAQTKYAPFSDEEVALLQAAYRRDLEALEHRYPEIFLA